jgi:hypothetical protein
MVNTNPLLVLLFLKLIKIGSLTLIMIIIKNEPMPSLSRIYLIKLTSTKNYKRTILLILKDVVSSRYLTLEDFGINNFSWLLSSVLPECYEKRFVY